MRRFTLALLATAMLAAQAWASEFLPDLTGDEARSAGQAANLVNTFNDLRRDINDNFGLSDMSNATLPNARYALGPNNACNPVTDFRADPTGGADAAAAINSCAAVTKNGKLVNIYLPAGTYYVANQITLTSGQCLYGDNRANTIISVDQAMNPAAAAVIVLTPGGVDPGPCIRDLDITFAQPSDQATRANFADLGSCTSGTGGTGCKYPPAIKITGASYRPKIQNVRIARAWKGISTAGGQAAPILDTVEMSALDTGLEFTGNSFDFSHIKTFHFWNFDIQAATALYTGVFKDGEVYAAKFGTMNGINIIDFVTFHGRIEIDGSGFWGQISNLMMDADSATLNIVRSASPGIQISNMYSTGLVGPGGTCTVSVAGSNTTVQISNWFAAGSGDADDPILCISDGRALVTNSNFNNNGAGGTQKSVIQTGGTLHLKGNRFGPNTAVAHTVPLVDVQAGTIAAVANNFPGSGTNVGSISIASDIAGHFLANNRTKDWKVVLGFTTATGYYDLGDQQFSIGASGITPSFVTPGDSSFANLAASGEYYLRGDYVEGRGNVAFDTNAYTTASGNFQLSVTNMPPPVSSGIAGCYLDFIAKVTITYMPGCNVISVGGVGAFNFQMVNSDAANTVMSTTEVPASKVNVGFRWGWRYRVR